MFLKYTTIMTKHGNYKIFSVLLIIPFFCYISYSSPATSQTDRQFVVIIDPGHGGKDPGAVYNGIQEKDAVLGIGLKLGKLIREDFPDVKVIFTRSTDVFVPLIDRSRIANKNKANLFISLHANFCGTPSIAGTETYVLGLHRSNENLEVAKKENSVILLEDNYKQTYQGFDPNLSESYIMFELAQDVYMDQSLAFANNIQQQFDSKLSSSNRGVKQAGFLVLRESSMPSVLVETGFISNPNEARYLMSEAGQSNIAHSILTAFKKFKEKNAAPALIASGKPIKIQERSDAVSEKGQSDNETENPANKPDQASEKTSGSNSSQAETEPDTTSTQKISAKSKADDSTDTSTVEKATQPSGVYYSVQIAASTTSVEPLPSNFKGIANIRREKSDKYYRYFVGRENSVNEIIPVWEQIRKKFPSSFVVSFKNGVRSIIDLSGK